MNSLGIVVTFKTEILEIQPELVSVSYKENLSELDLLESIEKIKDPQVVFWYIGAHGLKKEGVAFYKNKVGHILK